MSTSALLSAGFARYGMRGSFGQGFTNVDYAQRTVFAGLQLANFTGTLFVFEQRYRL